MTDYTPGFQDYLNNVKEKNPKVDRDYTVADLAVLYTLGCMHADGAKGKQPLDIVAMYTVECCGLGAILDETVWLKGENNGH